MVKTIFQVQSSLPSNPGVTKTKSQMATVGANLKEESKENGIKTKVHGNEHHARVKTEMKKLRLSDARRSAQVAMSRHDAPNIVACMRLLQPDILRMGEGRRFPYANLQVEMARQARYGVASWPHFVLACYSLIYDTNLKRRAYRHKEAEGIRLFNRHNLQKDGFLPISEFQDMFKELQKTLSRPSTSTTTAASSTFTLKKATEELELLGVDLKAWGAVSREEFIIWLVLIYVLYM